MIYAEKYRNSGRLTGRWQNLPATFGDWTEYASEEEFYADFQIDVHDAFHTENRADFDCPHCMDECWVLDTRV